MTALTIPPEVAAECSKKLFALAAAANRDSMTLVKQAMALAKNEEPARPLSTLKKYVRMYDQYGSGEVSEVIASIEAAADSEIYKRLCRYQARQAAERAERDARDTDTLKTAHAVMREREASRELIEAVLDFHEGKASPGDIEVNLPGGSFDRARARAQRDGEAFFPTLWKMEAEEREAANRGPCHNVVAGPWDAGGEARP